MNNVEVDYIVYMHRNKINGKIYIGTTKQSFEKRCGKNGTQYKSQPFYEAIQKYGWDNFEHLILYENLSRKEAEQKEIELISYYKSNYDEYGYNTKKGGFGKKIISGNVSINVRMPIEMKEELRKEASKIGLSLATYIRYKLSEFLKETKNDKK